MTEIPVALIDIGPNPRTRPQGIEDLAASIRSVGILQPIRVRPSGARFRLIFGQRRLLAARHLGLVTIPATVTTGAEDDDLITALIENIQRQDLNPMERARAVQALAAAGKTQRVIADDLGWSAPRVSNTLALLSLIPAVAQLVELGDLSEAHAKAICRLDPRLQMHWSEEAMADRLSSHALEDRIEGRLAEPRIAPSGPPPAPRILDQAREALAEAELLLSPVHLAALKWAVDRAGRRFAA